jgi:hypothetical protein
MSAAISALTGGCPVRFGQVHLRMTKRRCQRRTVPGVTSRCARTCAGKSRISAARTARSAQSSRGRGWVRRTTATSCRSTGSSAGQALIRVTAAPVCPLDLLCASGTSYFGPPPLPYAPGAQGVGIVAEADTRPAGQRVWFSCDAGMKPGDGAMAELCLAEETSILPVPDHVSDDLVAALGLSAIAAWTALSLRGGLQPGEHVLVLGASGTVGQVGVQAARLLGAGRVTAACRCTVCSGSRQCPGTTARSTPAWLAPPRMSISRLGGLARGGVQ